MSVPLFLLSLVAAGPAQNPAKLQAAAPVPSASAAQVLAQVTESEAKCRRLETRLAACRAAGRDIAYPDAALAVAQLFCRFSRYDAGQPDLRAAALRSMDYVNRTLDQELQKSADVLAGRARYPAIPRWNTIGVTWRDGGFWVGKDPVFLSGFNWDAGEIERDPNLMQRLGVNLSDGMFRGAVKADGSFDDAAFHRGDGQFLAQMARSDFPVDCLFGMDLPQSLIDKTPGLAQPGYGNGYDYVVDHPRAAQFRSQFLDHYSALYAACASFFAVDLANEPAFQGPSQVMLANWREWLRRKYGSLSALNRAWGVKLASFEEVRRHPSEADPMHGPWDRSRVDFAQPGARGQHYDWCAFNNERISSLFRSMSEQIHTRAPRAATHVKVMMGLYFTGSTESRGWRMDLSYHTFGIDPEALAHSCSLLGGDLDLVDLSGTPKPNRRFGSIPYVCGWLDAGLAADYLKSLAPDKPFYNSEFHIAEDNTPAGDEQSAEAHIKLALWLAHLHGMSGNLAWYWGRDAASSAPTGREWFEGSLLQQPWMLQGYAQESLSLRRFVRPVMAFSRQAHPIRLLYSEASAIQDVHYLDALRDSYEALNFLGVPIGFVTERQLAGGVPQGTQLVIIPNARYVEDQTVKALQTANARGVKIGVIGDESLRSTSTGISRRTPRLPGAEQIPLGSPQSYQPRLNSWIRSAGISRQLIALDSAGQPAWGIEVRTAHEGGRRLAYLVNLTRSPVRVTVHWLSSGSHLRDLRTGAAVPDAVTLVPRQLIFGSF